MTTAAELGVALLVAVVTRPAVLVYLTWLTFYVVLTAPLKVRDAHLIQTLESLLVAVADNLRAVVVVVAGIGKGGAVGSGRDRRV